MEMTFTGERYVPELRGKIAYEHRHRYASALALARDRDVLDVASGEGYGTFMLAGVARSAIGVDIDEPSVRHAASRYTAANLRFRVAPATALPLADASVDLIVCFETLEHVVEQRQMMVEFVRVLRPTGRLIISSPNKLVYSDAPGFTNAFHVHEMYFDEFRDLVGEFFPALRLFGQRIFGGSAIHPLAGTAPGTAWLAATGSKGDGISALPAPEYFLGIAGLDANDALVDLSSVYIDPADDLLTDVRGGGLAEPAPAPAAVPEREHAEVRARAERVREAEMQAREALTVRLANAESEKARIAGRVTLLEGERDHALRELATATAERDAARARAAASEGEIATTRARLESAEQRVALLEAERDEVRGELASALGARDDADSRIAELETTVSRIQSELDESIRLAELASDRARDELAAVDAERRALEERLEGLAGQQNAFAVLERERDQALEDAHSAATRYQMEHTRALAVERDFAALQHAIHDLRIDERIARAEHAASFERDLLAARLAALERVEANPPRAEPAPPPPAPVAEVDDAQLAEARARIASLERARARLNASLEDLARERDTLRAELDEAAANDDVPHLRNEIAIYRTTNLELERQVAHLAAALERSEAFAGSLADAHADAARTIAELESANLRLEIGVTARVAESEERASRSDATTRRLRGELATLSEALRLREGQLMTLDRSIREKAAEEIRALEIQSDAYRAMLAALHASKFWKFRRFVARLLGRSRPRRVPAPAPAPAKPARAGGGRRPASGRRHLRSA
jgi:SAM-dependent methyltransferase